LRHPQDVLVALSVHSHSADDEVFAKDQAVQVDDEQLQLIKAPGRQALQFLGAGFDKLAADAGFADPHALGHLRDHPLIVAGRDVVHQDRQQPGP